MASLFDHPLISQRYFFPRPDRVPDPVWVECNGVRLACAHLPAPEGRPTVVHFHGNGEVVADYLGEVAEQVTALDLGLFLVEYRGYGGSSGEPGLAVLLDDAEAVLGRVGAAPERLILFGRSVGSIFAIHAAARHPRVAGLILESAIAEPLERVLLRVEPWELGVSPEVLEGEAARILDHRAKLAAYPGPTLVLHADDDSLVAVDNAHRLASWTAGPCRVRTFASGDHNAIMAVNWGEYWREVAGFVEGLGRGTAGPDSHGSLPPSPG